MALTDARVKFLRGTLANMPTTLTDGNVYITTDERGMYVDYNDGSENKRIRIGDLLEFDKWADISAQSGSTYSTSALYYAKQENILGKWDGTKWTQINAPTKFDDIISDMNYNITVGSNAIATIKLNVVDQNNIDKFSDKLTYKIQSLDANVLRVTTGNDGATPTAHPVIKLRVKDLQEVSELSTVASNYSANSAALNLSTYQTGTDAAGTAVTKPATLTPTSVINFKGANLTAVMADASGNITIRTDLGFTQAFDATGALKTTITNNIDNIDVATLSVTPHITYGKTGATVTKEFVSGTAVLDIYTKTQTDEEIAKALRANNAMTYKGGLGTTAAGGIKTTLPLDDDEVRIGDTYKVVTAGTYNIKNGTPAQTQTAIVGDMFIAISTDDTEEADGYIAKSKILWTYIPSGNDDQTAYTISYDSTAQKLFLSDGTIQFGAALAIGNDLTATSSGAGSSQVITVAHKTYSAVTPAADANAAKAVGTTNSNRYSSATFTAVTGITTSNGHVTGIKTGTFQVQLNKPTAIGLAGGLVNASGAAIAAGTSANSTRANLTTTLTLADNTDISGDMKLSSSTFTFRKASASADLTVDLLWETF